MIIIHILFLVQGLKRIRTTFNTREAYRIHTELLDSVLHKALVLDVNVEDEGRGGPPISGSNLFG
jgi:hypothetical protein